MDIKEYIESGVIEQYVLGLANAEEAAELEQLRSAHPEINEAVLNFEKGFEEHLLKNQVHPPTYIKTELEQQLFGNDSAKILSINNSIKQSPLDSPWRYLAAACIVLLVVSTALNFYFYSGYKDSKQQYEALLTERNTLQANNASYQQSMQMFEDSSMMHIELKGMPGREQNEATILWDKISKYVYIYANNMQQTPVGKQYQLWAIVNGKPVSAGIVSNCAGFCKMKKVDHAEAFAITLENEGGAKNPTLTEMYVMGKV